MHPSHVMHTVQDLPPGFVGMRSGRWHIAACEGVAAGCAAGGSSDPVRLAAGGDPCFRGRGHPVRVFLSDGSPAVLRRYEHGGVFAALLGGRFFGRPRPLRELAASEEARRAGVRVPEVVAAYVRPLRPFRHMGFLLTREVGQARDLVEAFRSGEPPGPVLHLLGEEVRRLHEAGVWHADLHVKNVLLAGGAVTLIDFDRARIMSPVPERMRIRNLLRFDRSVVKLANQGIAVA
ncbi:MAG: lipopolysaccharide kinase InaA family protein, partial [Desulfohalobiaceae bacterium]